MTGAAAGGSTDRAIAAAYSATGSAWRDGPGAVYGRLAEELVGCSPVPVPGSAVVDIGAGTGAGSAAAHRAGASRVVAVDAAIGVLAVDAAVRPPALVADATALPFPDGTFDLALAAFSLNHLADPAAGLREASRVVCSGGAVLASSYADDDTHPVKRAVEDALAKRGWRSPAWQQTMYRERAPQLADEEGCGRAVDDARLEATITRLRVELTALDARSIVAWRLGMAQHASFVAELTPDEREAVIVDVLSAVGEPFPPLVRSMMVIAGRC